MSKFTGPTWKVSRRLNYSISETGKELLKRPFAPGQHGRTKKQKLKEYGIQLHEKQKVRFTYGVNEKQFKKTFNEANKLKGKTGENFIILLESRFDNLVYRAGFASTRAQARQLVNHGHFLIDGKKVDIPSYRLKPNQVISLKPASKELGIIKVNLESKISRLAFIDFNSEKLEAKYIRLPERNEVLPEIKEQLIVEFYNR